MSKCRDETRANFELNPTKPKLNAKTPDRIRSMMASIGAEPGRAARDVMNVSWYSAILKTAKGWGKFTDLYDTMQRRASGHLRRMAQQVQLKKKRFVARSTSKMKPPLQGRKDFRAKISSYIGVQFFRYKDSHRCSFSSLSSPLLKHFPCLFTICAVSSLNKVKQRRLKP